MDALLANIELFEKLFPLWVVTDNNGTVTAISAIFNQLQTRLAKGQVIYEALKDNALIFTSPENDFADNIPFIFTCNVSGLRVKLYKNVTFADGIFWVANIIAGQAIKLASLPPGFKQFMQYEELIEQTIAINSARLSLQDATELHAQLIEREARLDSAENQYKRVVECVNDVIFETDAYGNWTFLNPSWTRILEFSIEESLYTPFYNYLHPDDVKKNEALFLPLINRKKKYCSHQIRYIDKSGKVKFIQVYATLIIDANNNAIGTAGTLRDITLQLEQEKNYKLITENVQEIVALYDDEGKYRFVSPSVTKILGYSPKDLIGTRPSELFHPEDRAKFTEHFVSVHHYFANHPHHPLFLNYRVKNKKNFYIWIEAVFSPITDDALKIIGYISSARIIEERKRAEGFMLETLESHRQLNEQKSKIISLVSHEFRNPISSVQISSDILKTLLANKPLAEAKQLSRHITNIDIELKRLKDSLDNILVLGKIEAGTLQANKRDILLPGLLGEVIKRVKNILKDNREPKVVTTGRLRNIHVDPLLLSLIIENIISNAFKYSPEKRPPVIKINYKPGYFAFMVKDFGIGIPSNEQNKLFSSFFRASNTRSIAGIGLGLVVVKNFVEMHQGEVKLHSHEGQGTEVMIKIKG
jgi:PAS domain S-box-containing protein